MTRSNDTPRQPSSHDQGSEIGLDIKDKDVLSALVEWFEQESSTRRHLEGSDQLASNARSH